MSEPICINPTMIRLFLNVFLYHKFIFIHMQMAVHRDQPKCHLETSLVSEVSHLIVNNDQHREQDILAHTGCCLKKLNHCHTIMDVFPDCVISKQPLKNDLTTNFTLKENLRKTTRLCFYEHNKEILLEAKNIHDNILFYFPNMCSQ